MKFNQYTWSLYKQSPDGQKAIQEFEDAKKHCSEIELLCKYNPAISKDFNRDKLADIFETLWAYKVSEYENINIHSLDDAKRIYEEIISCGISVEGESWIANGDYDLTLELIHEYSILLYYFNPEYFIPHLFIRRFFDLNKLADIFEIELPTIPKKSDYKARCMYYWQLCEVFYQFRTENNLSPAELCAFLYNFVPNYIPKVRTDILKPTQAWFIGGLISSEEKDLDTTFWQANPETKKGDILIHYETSPISAITCIWIAQTDGVIDPFFHYYSNTYISSKIVIPHITLKDLQADKYFSKHPLVRKKFQGVNGWAMSSDDYYGLLQIIKEKGDDIDTLPKLYAPILPKNITIAHERDVETQLLEPLLNSMSWYENKDFIRQLSIHAGRGHRIFPDYALHYDDKQNEEKAQVLIEAKLHMKNNREIEQAFLQARSYALLLESLVIILCDKDHLIVYEKGDSFDRDNYLKYYWADLKNPDKFNELKNMLNI